MERRKTYDWIFSASHDDDEHVHHGGDDDVGLHLVQLDDGDGRGEHLTHHHGDDHDDDRDDDHDDVHRLCLVDAAHLLVDSIDSLQVHHDDDDHGDGDHHRDASVLNTSWVNLAELCLQLNR